MEYREEDYLQISGIQHFGFCRRRWALIYIEQQWQENVKTALGHIVHENCHDDTMKEKRNDLIVSRGLRVSSRELGVTGQCDVVEFRKSMDGVTLQGKEGRWQPRPVEYKLGSGKKSTEADSLQLCCQAMCLEEMLGCYIQEADIFYCEPHRRERVVLTDELREKVKTLLAEMHGYYSRGYTPSVKPKPACKSCSLVDICKPKLITRHQVDKYYDEYMK